MNLQSFPSPPPPHTNECCTSCSVVSPINQEGQSERTFPIFAFSSWFFPSFSWFSLFFLIFGKFYAVKGVTLPALPTYWLGHCVPDCLNTQNETEEMHDGKTWYFFLMIQQCWILFVSRLDFITCMQFFPQHYWE